MIKKLIAMACAVVLSLSLVPQGFAEEGIEVINPVGGMYSEITGVKSEVNENEFVSAYASSGLNVYTVLENGIRNHAATINISMFGINESEIFNIYRRVLFENADLMAYTSMGYGYNEYTNTVTSVSPRYLFANKAADDAARAVMEKEIQYYLDLAENVPDALGKLLVIHDEFAKKNTYAYEEWISGWPATPADWVVYTAYGAFVNNRAVCQGNSIALAEIYERLGIETGFVLSEELKHMWNIVKLDGEWYHLDETWNDPVMLGKDDEVIIIDDCRHTNFLVSEDMIRATGHDASDMECWADENVSCTDTKFESGYIFNGADDGWFGNISYENGRYKVLLYGLDYEFYSKNVASPGAIATDVLPYDTTRKFIILFANSDLSGTNIRIANYDNGQFVASRKGTAFNSLSAGKVSSCMLIPADVDKVFFWKNGTQEPVCEAREIN